MSRGPIYRPRLVFYLTVAVFIMLIICSALWRWWEPPPTP